MSSRFSWPEHWVHNLGFSASMPTIGSFCEFKYGQSLPEKTRKPGPVPVYGSNGIVGYHDAALTAGPTIIVGRKGSAGAIQFSDGPCHPIDTTYYIDKTCTSANLRWLFFMLQCLGLDALSKHAALPGLNRNDVYEKELPLPSTAEQARIAVVLDKADALCRWRQESIQLATAILRSVFLDTFGDPAENPKHFPIRRLGDFFSEREGAKCGPFGSALKKSETQQEGVPVWGIDNISSDGRFVDSPFSYISGDKFKELAAYEAANGDIIISRAGTVGRMCVVESSSPRAIIGSNLIRLRLDPDLLSPYYFVALMTYCKDRVARLRAGPPDAFTHMSTRILETLEFPYPPTIVQREFLSFRQKVVLLRDAADSSATFCSRLSSSLQHRAFRGELNPSRVALDSGVQPHPTSAKEVSTPRRGRYSRPGTFIAPPDIEAQMTALEDKLGYGPGDSIPWSENYFKYRILSQVLLPPFNFEEIWQEVVNDIEDPDYETVRDIVFKYIQEGLLEQRFDEETNGIVFWPNP